MMDIVFEEKAQCGRCREDRPVIDLSEFNPFYLNCNYKYFYSYSSPTYLCSTCIDILADELRKRSDAVVDSWNRN